MPSTALNPVRARDVARLTGRRAHRCTLRRVVAIGAAVAVVIAVTVIAGTAATAGPTAATEQAAWVAEDPRTYSATHTSGRYGWIMVRLAGVGRDELSELITEGWRLTAPARLTRSAR